MNRSKKLILTGIFTAAVLILPYFISCCAFAAGNSSGAVAEDSSEAAAEDGGETITEDGGEAVTEDDGEIKVRKLEMAMDTATVRVNQERTLFVEIYPHNATDQSLEWVSSNPEVVMVAGDGVIVGVSPGTAKVTAVSNNRKTAVCAVTVPASVLPEIEQQTQNGGHPQSQMSGGEVLSAPALRLDVENEANTNRKSSRIVLTYTGKTRVSTAALRSAAYTAKYHSKEAVLQFRTLDSGGKLQGRLTVDPEYAGLQDADVRVGVYTESLRVAATETRAEQYFKAPVAVVRLAQEGPFPMSVEVAAKVDLTGLDGSDLKLYRRTGASYVLYENQNYRVDDGGYIHFSVSQGGTFVFV